MAGRSSVTVKDADPRGSIFSATTMFAIQKDADQKDAASWKEERRKNRGPIATAGRRLVPAISRVATVATIAKDVYSGKHILFTIIHDMGKVEKSLNTIGVGLT